MLNLDQAFTVQEFVRVNRTKRVWEIQDELYSLICILTKTKEEKKDETETAADNMVVVVQVGLDLYTLSYVKYEECDIQQYIKYDLSSEDVSQFLGNN